MSPFDGCRLSVLRAILCAAALAGAATAATAQADTGYYFMRLPHSAHTAATAHGTLSPSSADVHQFMDNPAVLSETHHRQMRFSYINHVGDLNAGGMAYGHRFSGIGTVGAGLRYLGYGSMERTNELGEQIGSFDASDGALTVGLGRRYTENLRIGVAGHLISSSIDNLRATALGFDAGILYQYEPFDLTLGASINNVGKEISGLGSSTAKLPQDIRFYATKRLQYVPLILSITGYNLNRIGTGTESTAADILIDHLRFGGTLELGSTVRVRFGYNPRRHRALRTRSRLDTAGITAGFGLQLFRIAFDYTYESWSSFGGLHYLTVGTKL